MLTNSLKISHTTKTEFLELKFFQSEQKILPCRFQRCFRPFSMLTVHKCSDTWLFSYLSNHAFCSLYFRKYIRCEAHPFFQNVKNLMQILKIQKNVDKIVLVFKITAFELVALNTHFYRDKRLVIGNQCVNKQSQGFRYY